MFELKSGRKHIKGLDALRAFAIMLITLFHVFPETFVGGYIGVCLFLVITGFLLAYGSSCDYASDNFSLRNYFFKRLKRLYPPIIFVILVTVGIYHFILPGTLEDSGKEIISIIFGFNNWWQLAMSSDYFARVINASPFTHMWFLGVEIEYVILWPMIFILCTFFESRSIFLLAFLGIISAFLPAIFAFQGVDISRIYYGTDTRIFSCLFGGALGLWFAKHGNDFQSGRFFSLPFDILFQILILPILVATFLLRGQNLLLYEGAMQILTLIFCLMLFAVIYESHLGDRLEISAFKWLGKYSYEIFLWQYPVIVLFQRKGWHNFDYGPYLEIFMIFLLAYFSKNVLKFISNPKMPFSEENFKLRLSCCAFALTAIFSAVIMCFGMHDVLASDFNPKHKPGYKLQMEIEQRQAELAKAQAERAAREAAEAERIRTEQELFAARLRGRGITMIGDSIMVCASPGILDIMPEVDMEALSSRDVCGGFEVAQKLQQEGRLTDIVVIALGTNGPLLDYEPYATGMQNLLNLLGSERQIFWITVYCSYSQWMAMNNQYLAELANSRPNFHLIDWYPIAVNNPELLESDGTHPNLKGAVEYAKLIQNALAQELSPK